MWPAVSSTRSRSARRPASRFAFNVQRFGLLLDREAIRQQYARYNRERSQDTATQKVLAAILNTIESRATPSVLAAARKGAARGEGGPAQAAVTAAKGADE